jgi:hypothetical protein
MPRRPQIIELAELTVELSKAEMIERLFAVLQESGVKPLNPEAVLRKLREKQR